MQETMTFQVVNNKFTYLIKIMSVGLLNRNLESRQEKNIYIFLSSFCLVAVYLHNVGETQWDGYLNKV